MGREDSLLYLIGSDIKAWERIWGAPSAGRTPLKTCVRLLWTFSGLRGTALFRVSEWLHRKRIRVLPQVFWRLNITLHGLDIPPVVDIGPGLYIPHPVGTVVMARRIGANCTLVSGITIGLRDAARPIFPELGDDVYIGAGARVLGEITIGNGAKVGANAVVTRSVPDNAVAVGVPARLIVSSEDGVQP